MEVETQIQIAVDLGYVEEGAVLEFFEQSAKAGRIVNGLMKALRRTLSPDH